MVNFRNNLYNNLMVFILQEIRLIFNMILINCNYYKHLITSYLIKYLYNKNKIKYNDIGLHISKGLINGIETPKGKMWEMIYWQSVYNIHKGKGITEIEANNKK